MAAPLSTALVVVLTALLVGVATGPVLRRLPEPLDQPDKTAYRELPSAWFVVTCALLAALAELLALSLLPLRVQPLWAVLATCGLLLAAVDARTTWLPLRLTRIAWAAMLVAAVVSLPLGATLGDLARTAVGAAVAGLLYLLIRAATRGGFGFGDVRFAPLLGAATGAHSWTLLLWGLTLGSAVGAVHGVVRLLGRRPGSFAYAPSMLAGCYLAAVALHYLVLDPGP